MVTLVYRAITESYPKPQELCDCYLNLQTRVQIPIGHIQGKQIMTATCNSSTQETRDIWGKLVSYTS